MGVVRDLTGMVFGKLTVVKNASVKGQRNATWLCRCECGNEKVCKSERLTGGKNASCGCLRHDMAAKVRLGWIADITGTAFGRWTVLGVAESKGGKASWRCRCECGAEKIVTGDHLRRGASLSCGCVLMESLAGRAMDILGKKFGRLTVTERTNGRIDRSVAWKAMCDCGKEVTISATKLRSGKTRSCGCLGRELAAKRRLLDLTGQVFGRLTAIGMASTPKRQAGQITKWICRCECGNETVVACGNLRSGHIRSCGCLLRESTSRIGTEFGMKYGRGHGKHKWYGVMSPGQLGRVRSSYEAMFISILWNYPEIKWEYEPKTFRLAPDMRYTPDFRLTHPETGDVQWVEVKGVFTDKAKEKVRLFRDAGNAIVVLGEQWLRKNLRDSLGMTFREFDKLGAAQGWKVPWQTGEAKPVNQQTPSPAHNPVV